jgi:hypothetical protein
VNVKRRGFGSMTAAKRSEIARLGGRAAHAKGTAHRWTRDDAVAAAEKSAESRKAKRAAASEDPAV